MLNPTVTNHEEAMSDDNLLQISVTNPQKVGEGMAAYVTYQVTTSTNLPYFEKKIFTVSRRFSDFLGLHDKLVEKYLHLGIVVPPAPEKSVMAMKNVKMSKEDNLLSDEFIEKRRAALERYINMTASHPVLRMDPEFRDFLSKPSEFPKASNISALSGANVLSFFNTLGDSVNKMTFQMTESDTWFKVKQNQIDKLDEVLRILHSCIEALVQRRKALSEPTALFVTCATTSENCEEHSDFTRSLSNLASVEKKFEQLQSQQANHDFYLLSELLKDVINLISVVKEVFYQRIKAYQAWQHAKQNLTEKRAQKAKLESAGATLGKIQQAKEVIDWEEKEERGKEEFDSISNMIHTEVEHFERTTISDCKRAITKYVEQMFNQHENVLECLKSFDSKA